MALASPPTLAPRRAWVVRLVAYAALAAVVVALGLARIRTGPWYATYGPDGTRVLESAPSSWEARYYLDVVSTFTSDRPPRYGFAPVHHRTLINLYLASLLYVWTGRVYAAFAVVDFLFWFLACAAVFHVARRFAVSPRGAACAALVTAASPILVSNMWRHDLHVANFATMAIGLWAMLATIDSLKRDRELVLALGTLLVLLSLSYQYQWTLLPVLVVLLLARAHYSLARAARVTAGAIAVFIVGTLGWRVVLHLGGLSPSGVDVTVVSDPAALLSQHLASVRAPADVFRLFPRFDHLSNTARAYHPVVFAAGWLGLLLLPRHALGGALAASAAALFAISLYGAPWTAMSAYPFVYVGVGRLCAMAQRLGPIPGALLAAAGVLILMAATNSDLWGDYRFMLEWWRQYAAQTVF